MTQRSRGAKMSKGDDIEGPFVGTAGTFVCECDFSCF